MVPSHSRESRLPSHAALVIFGATGDLTQRKLIPALFRLFQRKHLPDSFSIVCFARREFTDQAFRDLALESLVRFTGKKPDPIAWGDFSKSLTYLRGDFNEPDAFIRLKSFLEKAIKDPSRVLYHFATAPEHFSLIVDSLHSHGLAARHVGGESWPRVVFEKPFGSDLGSARDLNKRLSTVFSEEQIFRVDHYLGKETVQNILVMRFANSIYESVWNSRYIDNVQITAAESIGIEGRGSYYDTAGALRDMVQNHLLQLLTFVAMEPPSSLDASAIHDEKVKVLKSLRPLSRDKVGCRVVRGQYEAGTVASQPVPAYLDEKNVLKGSRTETFVAMCVHVHNWRWEGVPFFLRTGKCLNRRTTEIVITFKPAPGVLFSDPKLGAIEPNRLILRIAPDEGIALRFNSKRPVTELFIDPVLMDFCHSCIFSPNTPEAYERLIFDALAGDSTLFTRWDEVESAWEFVDPIRKAWDADKKPTPLYKPGTWGPKAAEDLIASQGKKWFDTSHGH